MGGAHRPASDPDGVGAEWRKPQILQEEEEPQHIHDGVEAPRFVKVHRFGIAAVHLGLRGEKKLQGRSGTAADLLRRIGEGGRGIQKHPEFFSRPGVVVLFREHIDAGGGEPLLHCLRDADPVPVTSRPSNRSRIRDVPGSSEIDSAREAVSTEPPGTPGKCGSRTSMHVPLAMTFCRQRSGLAGPTRPR